MTDTSIIDTFLATFSTYIDSGFGLLRGEINYLSTTLIIIDMTIAGLFWAWGADEDVMHRLVKKTLSIGFFAWLIGNFNSLANIVFNSFAGLGLKAAGSTMSMEDFLRPGHIGDTGISVALQLLNGTKDLLGPIGKLTNLPEILMLLAGASLIMLAFFIMAIQIFVTVIEFKLTTLCGFVLLPFAFFGRTAFMAEKVLGNVISTGVKLLVLAVVTGIGTTLFQQLILDSGPVNGMDLKTSMSLVLAALSLLGLSIFGPGVANGIIAGGPQLGAGSAVGTAMVGAGVLGASIATARMAGGMAASSLGGAAQGGMGSMGGASAAQASAMPPSRDPGFSSSSAGSRPATGGAASSGGAGGDAPPAWASQRGGSSGGSAGSAGAAESSDPDEEPAWSRRARAAREAAAHTAHTLRGVDSHGPGASVDLGEKKED